MKQCFLDTSALAKRYVDETGSRWIREWFDHEGNNDIIISALTTVEMYSLLARREREGSISQAERQVMQNDLQFHIQEEYLIIDLDDEVLAAARSLLLKYKLRTLDALQLACAVETPKLLDSRPTFITADTRLLTAAAGEGLPTDDPNAHP